MQEILIPFNRRGPRCSSGPTWGTFPISSGHTLPGAVTPCKAPTTVADELCANRSCTIAKMAWSSEGDCIAVALRLSSDSYHGWEVLVYQGSTGRLLMQHSTRQGGPIFIVWSPAGAFLMIADFARGRCYLLDVDARKSQAVLAGCTLPCWSPNAQSWATKRTTIDMGSSLVSS